MITNIILGIYLALVGFFIIIFTIYRILKIRNIRETSNINKEKSDGN